MHPEWNKSWDTGVVAGRVLQVVLLNGTTPIADATMRQQVSLMFIHYRFITDVYFLLGI